MKANTSEMNVGLEQREAAITSHMGFFFLFLLLFFSRLSHHLQFQTLLTVLYLCVCGSRLTSHVSVTFTVLGISSLKGISLLLKLSLCCVDHTLLGAEKTPS